MRQGIKCPCLPVVPCSSFFLFRLNKMQKKIIKFTFQIIFLDVKLNRANLLPEQPRRVSKECKVSKEPLCLRGHERVSKAMSKGEGTLLMRLGLLKLETLQILCIFSHLWCIFWGAFFQIFSFASRCGSDRPNEF